MQSNNEEPKSWSSSAARKPLPFSNQANHPSTSLDSPWKSTMCLAPVMPSPPDSSTVSSKAGITTSPHAWATPVAPSLLPVTAALISWPTNPKRYNSSPLAAASKTTMKTKQLTTAQAIIQFLMHQHVERDGRKQPFFAGCLGIFGHGCIAGVGQALQQYPQFKYFLTKNEQASVHIAAAYAKMQNRLRTFACVSSIGPGATNMVTSAALATVNRLPVLLLPGDIFSRRNVAPVLQQLEQPYSQDISVNDAFKPVSKYWDRINRADQIITALPEIMRVLTSQAEMGAVTLALPQDVQTEAWDYPAELFEDRVWYIPRPAPEATLLARAVELIRTSRKPFI